MHMAVMVRGATRNSSQPRPPVSAKPSAKPSARRPKAAAYTPAKLAATRRVGLSPLTALSIAGLVAALGGLAVVASDTRARSAVEAFTAQVDRLLVAQGLVVRGLTIQGATPEARNDIARASQLSKGEPILHLDLDALRHRVEQVGWVKSARVVRLLPDTIVIAVVQRTTFAVWQHDGRAVVIDNVGHAIPEADPARFAGLPLVVGDGADEAAPRILPIVRAHPLVMQRLDALVRVDERRWDLRMKDGGLIQLPAEDEDAALMRLDALDQKSRIMALGFERIDLRDPELVAVRPRQAASQGRLVANGA
jgi:cell division protein FtsQ